MSARVDPFAILKDVPIFEPKPKKEKLVASEAIDRLAEENNFVSRQASKTARPQRLKRRVYTTGRNRQFNLKAKTETVERFNRLADERGISLAALLELALDALDRAPR